MNEQNTPNEETPKVEQPKEPINWKSEILSWIQVIVAAAVIAFVITTFIIANSRIPSASMENTIMTGDRVIGSRANYLFFASEKGLYEKALEAGFLIRNCGNYRGLGEGYYRIAVRTKEENERWIAWRRGL